MKSERPVDRHQTIVWVRDTRWSQRASACASWSEPQTDEDGERYISTVTGRGYCFLATPSGSEQPRTAPPMLRAATRLHERLARMVGRSQNVRELLDDLAHSRLTTIVGAGGIGKTTVAVAVAHEARTSFDEAVSFVDLGVLNDPPLVALTVASALGLDAQANDAAEVLSAFLRDKRMLLIFDTCEHLIDSVAHLTLQLLSIAPGLHILATSREALQIDKELVHRLDPLDYPAESVSISASDVASYAAMQLFVDRAKAAGLRLRLSDADATLVSSICRKLDGVALAIALAAGRAATYGLQQTADLLDQHLSLVLPGQRTAPERQRTVQATLDWSYRLLTAEERLTLRRLAVFVGDFTLEAALEVATTSPADHASLFKEIDGLIAKSMLATRPVGATMRYRLLDLTRAYALSVDTDPAEIAQVSARHARYYRHRLEEAVASLKREPTATNRSAHIALLANVRAALEWCFSEPGDKRLGVELAAAAVPALLAISSFGDCRRWAERALAAMDESVRGRRTEMILQEAFGLCLTFDRGAVDAARVALERSLEIAVTQGSASDQLHLLCPMQMQAFRTGRFLDAKRHAEQLASIARTIREPTATALAYCYQGVSLHYQGELQRARDELEAAIAHGDDLVRARTYVGFEKALSASFLAMTLWLLGHRDSSARHMSQAVTEAESSGHPMSHFIVLIWAVTLDLWDDDQHNAERHIEQLEVCAARYGLGAYAAVGTGFRGALAVRRGHSVQGIRLLEEGLADLHRADYELQWTFLNIFLTEGLATAGRKDKALALSTKTFESIRSNGDFVHLPELLRVRAGILATIDTAGPTRAADVFLESAETCRRHGARSLEIRAKLHFAQYLVDRDRRDHAITLLRELVSEFRPSEGGSDYLGASRLLTELQS